MSNFVRDDERLFMAVSLPSPVAAMFDEMQQQSGLELNEFVHDMTLVMWAFLHDKQVTEAALAYARRVKLEGGAA